MTCMEAQEWCKTQASNSEKAKSELEGRFSQVPAVQGPPPSAGYRLSEITHWQHALPTLVVGPSAVKPWQPSWQPSCCLTCPMGPIFMMLANCSYMILQGKRKEEVGKNWGLGGWGMHKSWVAVAGWQMSMS